MNNQNLQRLSMVCVTNVHQMPCVRFQGNVVHRTYNLSVANNAMEEFKIETMNNGSPCLKNQQIVTINLTKGKHLLMNDTCIQTLKM